ncbi:hypothetical protein BC830DRAFT_1152080 [Chytriomyces sp. MP71]|nr:hypothetical protein BC830DRAFT_1152080 [Chytriomyces sp. MP71]
MDVWYQLAYWVLVVPVRLIPTVAPFLLAALMAPVLVPSLLPFAALPPLLLYPLAVFAAIETLWALVVFPSMRRFLASKRAETAPPKLPEAHGSPAVFLRRCFDEMGHDNQGKTGMELISGWFMDASPRDITLRDLRTWLAWAAFSVHPEQLAGSERVEIDAVLDGIKDSLDPADRLKFEMSCHEDGKKVKSMRHTLDPLVVEPKPFAAYAVTIGMNVVGDWGMSSLGFTKHHEGKVSYWFKGASSHETPIVFIHGIGVGLLPYLPFAKRLLKSHPTQPILFIELAHISMRLDATVPTHSETLHSLYRIPLAHGLRTFEDQPATWIGHSLGSVVCSWVILDHPSWVRGAVFVDPVVFGLWESDVCFNFLYRKPRTALELLMWYYVSQELHISYSIRRNFWWTRAVLFPEQLPMRVGKVGSRTRVNAAVFLSEFDQIVNTEKVVSHLTRNGIEDVTVWKGVTHGEVVVQAKLWDDVLGALAALE